MQVYCDLIEVELFGGFEIHCFLPGELIVHKGDLEISVRDINLSPEITRKVVSIIDYSSMVKTGEYRGAYNGVSFIADVHLEPGLDKYYDISNVEIYHPGEFTIELDLIQIAHSQDSDTVVFTNKDSHQIYNFKGKIL